MSSMDPPTVSPRDLYLTSTNEKTGALQYLDQSDLKQYLSAVLDRSDHFINDPSYLDIFHSEYISRQKDDKKKESE